MELKDRKALVVGLGRSGLAAAEFLCSRGARVTVTDVQPADSLGALIRRLPSDVRLRLGGHPIEEFRTSDFIVLSPGVPASLPQMVEARRAGVPILSEVELAFRFLSGFFVGITGSNGKTTTTSLLGEIFQAAGRDCVVAGNIGVPLTRVLNEDRRADIFVVELSSFQLETVSTLKCDVAVLLNLTPDHLDRYSDPHSYYEAKLRVFRNQSADDWAVWNADDPISRVMVTSLGARSFSFSLERPRSPGAFLAGGRIVIDLGDGSVPLMPVSDVTLRGRHNLANVLAAAGAAGAAGADPRSIAEAVRRFRGVEHRLEHVRRIDGVDYYNDSKATNIDATRRAVEAFDGPIVLILGGLDKEGDFRGLANALRGRVGRAVAFGRAAPKIVASLAGVVAVTRSASLEDAVVEARAAATPGSVVLLAPACASFDMFKDFEHRGRVFKEIVADLEESRSSEAS